jgi:hypothetical protein
MTLRTPATRAILPWLSLLAVACGGGGAPPPAAAGNAATSASASPPAAPSANPARAAASATGTSDAPASSAPAPPVPVPTSAVAKVVTQPMWATCHQSYKAKAKDTRSDVQAMAKACAATTKMKPVATPKPWTGKQADQDKPQSFAFEAKANHCYRAYAQASDGIKDLDLVVKDSADVIVGQDSTDDPSPVVMEDGAVCFSKDDKASVVVSVGMGSGTYSVELWSD